MYILNNPKWIEQNRYPYKCFDEIPQSVFDSINTKLERFQSEQPLVSIVIPAWNEEVNILNCISSMSNMITAIPFEIIVVNNQSTDETQKTIANLRINSFFQNIEGCGPARQMGQEKAKGKYILMADADCIYPNSWIDTMLNGLKCPGVVCVYGRYSFIGNRVFPRWKLVIYETFKDVIAELRHVKRPYLNTFGMNMGYVRDLGLMIGFVGHKIRGEDGRMCFDLMRFGKVKQIRSRKNRVWTNPRTLEQEGGFYKVFFERIKIELGRLLSLFFPHPPHDTKVSRNE